GGAAESSPGCSGAESGDTKKRFVSPSPGGATEPRLRCGRATPPDSAALHPGLRFQRPSGASGSPLGGAVWERSPVKKAEADVHPTLAYLWMHQRGAASCFERRRVGRYASSTVDQFVHSLRCTIVFVPAMATAGSNRAGGYFRTCPFSTPGAVPASA